MRFTSIFGFLTNWLYTVLLTVYPSFNAVYFFLYIAALNDEKKYNIAVTSATCKKSSILVTLALSREPSNVLLYHMYSLLTCYEVMPFLCMYVQYDGSCRVGDPDLDSQGSKTIGQIWRMMVLDVSCWVGDPDLDSQGSKTLGQI